ncbi:ABC transporter G family member 20-like isoform X5 [Varroa jacobsoni]|nr:ABC transporter G family member 20-like isoform X5 [Varroa jacobsoni]
MRRTQKLAVDVDRLRVTYGYGSRATEVLKGIDLTLPEGKIYGLLGPSGCGKTTLLRCIVGRKTPQCGQVRVFEQVPGTTGAFIPGPGVGYMPQELTLYPEFTIYETLLFFGKVFRMPGKVIQDRIQFLLKFLDLPDKGRLVKNLSGGQQRRVSLAAALIHKPPLLILDEPTVGVDPLLRQAIWNYLVTLTREQGMTVIVTTHYIEEARQANIVGLMRSGRMLAQDTPDRLLEDYNCTTLEDVFLQLCLADKEGRAIIKNMRMISNVVTDKPKDNSQITDNMDNSQKNHKEKVPIYETPLDVKHTLPPPSSQIYASRFEQVNSDGFSTNTKRRDSWIDTWCRALALVLKNITRVKRNIPVLLFTFIVPSFQVVLFCLCIGADPFELPMAIVNQDTHPILSQPFLESISNVTIIQRPYADLDEALASVERGETWGVIHIGHNYSTALQYRFLLGIEADNETIEESTVDIYMDMTNQQIGFILQKTIFESFIMFCDNLLTKMGKNVALAQLPVRVRDPVYGSGKPSFTEFMAPGIILSITYIMAVGLTAISIIMETREGTMERCWVAGVRPFEVVVSHVYSQFCVMVVQVALLLLFIFLVFQIPLEGSLLLVILLTLLQGLSGMTYGLVISSICGDEQSAMMLALGTFYPNLLLSGIIWPIQSMPRLVRYIAYGLPQTIPTESLRCIMYRGWGIDRDEVWIGYIVSLAWTIFFLLFATAAFKARS